MLGGVERQLCTPPQDKRRAGAVASESRMHKLAKLNADGIQARVLLGTASEQEIAALEKAMPLGVVDCEHRSRYCRVGELCSASVVSFARIPSSIVSVGCARYRSFRSRQVAGKQFVGNLLQQAADVASASAAAVPKARPVVASASAASRPKAGSPRSPPWSPVPPG